MAGRLTQLPVEVALDQASIVRLTQAAVEVAVGQDPIARFTQAAVEVGIQDSSFPALGNVRLTQLPTEAALTDPFVGEGTGEVRVSHVALDLLIDEVFIAVHVSQSVPEEAGQDGPTTLVRSSQNVPELVGQDALVTQVRVSQSVVEIIKTFTCEVPPTTGTPLPPVAACPTDDSIGMEASAARLRRLRRRRR